MCYGGLPGGSPGPNAVGTWRTLLFVFLVTVICGGLFLWLCKIGLKQVGLLP